MLTEILYIKCPHCKQSGNYNALYDCEWDAIICRFCHKKFKYDFSSGKDVTSGEE